MMILIGIYVHFWNQFLCTKQCQDMGCVMGHEMRGNEFIVSTGAESFAGTRLLGLVCWDSAEMDRMGTVSIGSYG